MGARQAFIDGVFRHQDSNGGGGLIADGDTQWMTGEQGCHCGSVNGPLTCKRRPPG
jgi:redox-sensitive bicupin YhaK (pirin superfamily)